MKRIVTAAFAALAASASLAGAAPTDQQKCQDAAAVAARKYFEAVYKAESKCRDARAVTGLPADCAVDPDVTDAITTAQGKLTDKLTAKCTDGLVAASIWGLQCTGVATVGDLNACIVDDVHGPRSEELITTAYGTSGQISDTLLRNCQKTISKALRKDASKRQKARRSCAKPKSPGLRLEVLCPDAKTAKKLGKSRDQLIVQVEKKCDDTQVLDAALQVGGECADDRVGAPPSAWQYMTYNRVGMTNSIPPRMRLSRCLAAESAVKADTGADAVYPQPAGSSFFPQGAAAGDATPTSFIAWTRSPSMSPVTLTVATDAELTSVVQTIPGLVPNPARDNTVKVEVTGLTPSTLYYYSFGVGASGRVRTAPAPSSTAPITFAFTGDSNAFFRPFSVLEGITLDDPEIFLYIGDTIYSDDTRSGTGEAMVLADYWGKYKENREDAALRDLMASVGTATIWDDHEVTNDFYGSPFGAFGPQIVVGNQAFRDYMPMREDGGEPMKLYRSIKWGDVAEFFLIDDRQYRSSQAYITEPACLSAGEPAVVPNATCTTEINNPARTYLGAAQKAWLKSALAASTATWKFVMNGPLITNLLFLPYDRWEGYGAERSEMLEFFRNPDGNVMTSDHLTNVVFLSTDIHAAIYNPVVTNPGPAGGSIREVVAGAIGMDPIYRELPAGILPFVDDLPALFPTIEFFDIDRRNYVHVAADTTQATLTYRDNTGSVLKTVTLTAE